MGQGTARGMRVALAAVLLAAAVGHGEGAAEPAIRTVKYEAANNDFPNPERGFYIQRSYPSRGGAPGALSVADLRAARQKNLSMVRMLYSLRSFREAPLPEALLATLSADFERAREAGVKVIPRFSYSSAIGQPDAALERILEHIEQLKPVLRAHGDVIALFEAGFAGAWGEWHSSTNGLFDGNEVNTKTRAILDKLLEALPADRMVVVRCPRFKTAFFGFEPLSRKEAFRGGAKARTGALNDCFLASADDSGTFTNRIAEEKAYLHQDNLFVPQGGETCGAGPAAQPFIACPNALKEMEYLRYSNLNADYHRGVLAAWESGGCMPEIRRRMGYRFRLVEARIPESVTPGAALRIEVTMVNDGWANLHNPRPVEAVLRNRATGRMLRLVLYDDPRLWLPGEAATVMIEGGVPAGTPPGAYDVLLFLPDAAPGLRARPEYAVRLANSGVWEPATGMNSVARITVHNAAGGAPYRGPRWFR